MGAGRDRLVDRQVAGCHGCRREGAGVARDPVSGAEDAAVRAQHAAEDDCEASDGVELLAGTELVALHLARELRQRLARKDGQLGGAGELVDGGCLVSHSSVVRAPSVGSGGSGVHI